MTKSSLFLSIFLLGTIACTNPSTDQKTSTGDLAVMYYNGDILTMEGDQPVYVEAVVVKDGKIAFAGSADEAMKVAGKGHKMVDLEGKTMLPGFIDAHGHLLNAGFQALSANLLPPPDGNGANFDALLEISNKWAAENTKFIEKAGWIIGFGYDDGQLKEKQHPTADMLDRVSTEVPVLFIHQSGHLGAVNHKGLEYLNYNETTPDPAGGLIRRVAGSQKPNGVLEEMALFALLFKMFSQATEADNQVLIQAGIQAYTKYGFTTAQEGRADANGCRTYRSMAAKNLLPIDVVAYPDIQSSAEWMKTEGKALTSYNNRFRVGGIKLSLDGSPQGKTAWLTKPYKVPPPGQPKSYKGYPAIKEDAVVNELIGTAFANNWQVLCHCNGDASGDQFLRAVRKAADQYGNNDRRTVMIHAQTVREDQLDTMKTLGVIPSFFSMHTFYWGDWHTDETLGHPRVDRISPTGDALKRGMLFTEHHDAPVANPDAIRVLDNTVNRTSRSGKVIGPDQCVTTYQGLQSITSWAAYQYFEEDRKGTIKAGKLADFVILDKNPVKIDPKQIGNLVVLETIKEGKQVYVKE